MFDCPSCGASLRFDITEQQLKCDYCGRLTDVDEYEKRFAGEDEKDEYDALLFGCSQCGAELVTVNESAVSYCAFCGSQSILSQKFSKEKRPEYMIPFRKTKEDCVESYRKLIKKSWFSPRQLREQEQLNRFTGIYIPYWVYGGKKEGDVVFSGEKAIGEGRNNKSPVGYRLHGHVKAGYEGLAFDASTTFRDQSADAIAPYPAKKMRPFAPSMLCGFYADTPDLPAETYQKTADQMIEQDMYRRMGSRFSSFSLPSTTSTIVPNIVKMEHVDPVCALFPVWFMSWKKKLSRNRECIAYAVINGETGKIAADIPVDEKRFFLISLMMALPIFLVLSLFLSMPSGIALFVFGLMSAWTVCIYSVTLRTIQKRMQQEAQRKGKERYVREISNQVGTGNGGEGTSKAKTESSFQGVVSAVQFVFAIVLAVSFFVIRFVSSFNDMHTMLAVVLALIAVGVLFYRFACNQFADASALSFLGLVAVIVKLSHGPAENIGYYMTILINFVAILITMYYLILQYNVLTTHAIPEYHEKRSEVTHG